MKEKIDLRNRKDKQLRPRVFLRASDMIDHGGYPVQGMVFGVINREGLPVVTTDTDNASSLLSVMPNDCWTKLDLLDDLGPVSRRVVTDNGISEVRVQPLIVEVNSVGSEDKGRLRQEFRMCEGGTIDRMTDTDRALLGQIHPLPNINIRNRH